MEIEELRQLTKIFQEEMRKDTGLERVKAIRENAIDKGLI